MQVIEIQKREYFQLLIIPSCGLRTCIFRTDAHAAEACRDGIFCCEKLFLAYVSATDEGSRDLESV